MSCVIYRRSRRGARARSAGGFLVLLDDDPGLGHAVLLELEVVDEVLADVLVVEEVEALLALGLLWRGGSSARSVGPAALENFAPSSTCN